VGCLRFESDPCIYFTMSLPTQLISHGDNIFIHSISIIYIKKIHSFGVTFSLSIILLNKFDHKNVILLVLLKNIRIYIICYIFDINEKYKYNLLQYKSVKLSIIYTYNFNQNLIKNTSIIYTH